MRHLPWLIFLLLASSCARHLADLPPGGEGAERESIDLAQYDQLVVVGTNDFHGYLRTVEAKVGGANVLAGGAEWFGGYADILRKKFGDRLLLLDGGDMFQGTMDSNMVHGRSVVDFYNLMPYRAVAVGNHEFDYGPEERGGADSRGALKARMRQAKYPFVQANIFKNGKLWTEKNLSPSVLVKAGGYKVGIIGLTTTTTPAKTLPKTVTDLEFREFAEPALAEAKKLRARGADLVLVTTHEGEGKPGDPIYKFLHALPKGTIDAVVAGHSHTEVHEFVNEVPVIESKTRGLFFGRIDLYVNKKTRRLEPSLTRIHGMQPICGTWFKKSDTCDQKAANDAIKAGQAQVADYLPLRAPVYEGEAVKPNLAVRKALAPYFARADRKRNEVVGTASADFETYPSGENQMGALILAAFHDRFPEAKAVFMNGGGIRRRLFKGPITVGDLYEVSPFDNFAVLVKINGRQMKDLVRAMVSGATAVPAIWGMKVHYYDRDDSAFDRDVNGDGKKEKWERDRLDPKDGLTWEKTGEPVRDEEVFWLATIDYLVAGGDNTTHVFKGIPESARKYFQVGPRDIVADYLKKHPGMALPRQDDMRVHGEGAGAPHEH